MPGPDCCSILAVVEAIPLAWTDSFSVLGYVGLGPGQEFIPYFLAFLAWAVAACVAILQWPLRALRRRLMRRRDGRAEKLTNGPVPASKRESEQVILPSRAGASEWWSFVRRHVGAVYFSRWIVSIRMRPLRALVLASIGVVLIAAGVNLWAWYHFREAGRLVDRQRFALAYSHYAQSLQVWRRSAATHFLAGRTARRAGLYAEAERHLAECQRLQGDPSVELALEHLLLRAQSGDIGAVEETLWKYVEKNKPETPLVLEALARGYLRVLRAGSARRCLQMLLERQPDHIEALLMRAEIREGTNEVREARADYRRVLELDPEREDARLSLAKSVLHSDPVEAHALFAHLLARQPDNVDVQLGLAQAQRALGELDKARALLEAILAKDPNNSKALTKLGTLTALAGKAAEAENLFRKAIAADPTNHEAHFHLYKCLARQPGKEDEADAQIALYERVKADMARLGKIATDDMSRNPNDPNLHYELGVLYLRYGKSDVGVRWLSSALQLDPIHQPSHQALYDYFQRIGDSEKAELHRAQLRPDTAKPGSQSSAPSFHGENRE